MPGNRFIRHQILHTSPQKINKSSSTLGTYPEVLLKAVMLEIAFGPDRTGIFR